MEQTFDPNTLKVNDLREELRRRKLNPLGVKAILLDRLSKALAEEGKTLEDFSKGLLEVKSPIKATAKVLETENNTAAEGTPDVVPTVDSAEVEKEPEVAVASEECVPTPKGEPTKEENEPMEAQDEEKGNEEPFIDESQVGDPDKAEKDMEIEDATKDASEELTEPKDISGKPDRSSDHGRSSDEENSRSRDRSRDRSRRRSRDRHHSRDRDRSRGHDHSSDRDKHRSPRRHREASISVDEEVEGWESSEHMILDFYNCDLNLMITKDGYSAKPLTSDGFCLMWAGVRSNYGVKTGKCFFEVKSVKELKVDELDLSSGGATHVLRVGWSAESTGLELGESGHSYGYGGTAKKSTNNNFEDYGCEFKEGDVVGAFLEVTEDDAIMSFCVNGANQGECFKVVKSDFEQGFALFPHIYVKNVEFAVNFGQDDQGPWFPPSGEEADTWKLVGKVPLEDRVRAAVPPKSKADCEVIMMIGLPGSGKTYYANNLIKEKPEKRFNLLGTNSILDKMKVIGLTRKRNYHGRWELLIEKVTQCLNAIISVACKRRRNFILDQTNVYPSAQRRKMRNFEGYQRRAIVIVPTDEEFKRRIEQRTKEEGKEVPEKAILEMKANFVIPKSVADESSSVFDEVIFTELQSEEAEALVSKYNEEGKASREAERRRRGDSSERSESRRGDRRDYRRHDYRSRYDSSNRHSGHGDYGRRDARNRFDYRNDRGDRGRFGGSGYRDGGRDFNGRVGPDDYGRGGGFGGFQRRGGFGGGPGPYRSDRPGGYPGGPPYGQYGPNMSLPPHFGPGGYRGADGGGRNNDHYGRGGPGGYGSYGCPPPSGYGYYQTGERRRYDQTGDGASSGAPPAKHSAYGDSSDSPYRGGYRNDASGYRSVYRGGRGGDRGAAGGVYAISRGGTSAGDGYSQGDYSGTPSYYGAYGQPLSSQNPPSKSSDSVGTSGAATDSAASGGNGGYGRSTTGAKEDYQQSNRGALSSYGGSGRPSRFSSATNEDMQQKPGASRFGSDQGYGTGKDNNPPRSRFDQSSSCMSQQSQDHYGGAYSQQSGERMRSAASGSNQDTLYGYAQSGRNAPSSVPPSSQKVQQGGGSDYSNQAQGRQQRPRGGYAGYGGNGSGNAYGRQSAQLTDSSQSYYKGYGDEQGGTSYKKPGQQQGGYDSSAYGQRMSSASNPTPPKFQGGYANEFQGAKAQGKQGQDSQQGYYQGYQSTETTNKSSHQQSYGVGSYGQQSASGQGQQRYGSESASRGGYCQQSATGAASKTDPRTNYDYSAYAGYGYANAFNPSQDATGASTGGTGNAAGANPAAQAAGAGANRSLYASALDAASKITSTGVGSSNADAPGARTQAYGSGSTASIALAALAAAQGTSAPGYNYGGGGYYGSTPAWSYGVSAAGAAGTQQAGVGSQAQQQQSGGGGGGTYGYNQR